MGGDQGLDDNRPRVVAHVAEHSVIRCISEPTALGQRIRSHLSAEFSVLPEQAIHYFGRTGDMFETALDCDCFTAAMLSYTLHFYGNRLPI